ncbi:fimbrial protein [Serratia bockelmannii]|nr:fimbrial protein [Serratia bockelmannii]MCW7649165.1 fimbrial protein [Serratia bockelmannii]MCW7659200.1 fimbrial protein [Serratia bockelmannii]MCW7678984.1 fimbrial protein [Serratia bockelmannii]MCW7683761.1 fimbrial protein [Serratia bockelmannii]MCW7688538.1 fimbrial protein [Serratia bockelmannii]
MMVIIKQFECHRKNILRLILVSLSIIAGSSMPGRAAVSCISGCGNIFNTINKTLTAGENSVGQTAVSSDVSTPGVELRVGATGPMQYWVAYSGESPSTAGYYGTDWRYQKIDDYISVSLRTGTPCYDTIYVPYNVKVRTGTASANCTVKNYSAGDTASINSPSFQSRIKINKRIVGGAYSKNIHLADYGFCQPDGCQSRQAIAYKIYLSLNITAPETCELNAGQVINIDFGNISSGAFKTAGTSAQGVQPKLRDISVKCDNIVGNAQLTLRLQADKTSGNIVVSDENNDVGFRVTNNSGVPLVPNNLSSVIPFALDSNARQNVTIQVVPVSVTGNKPTEGPVTSRAYLRVDFP